MVAERQVTDQASSGDGSLVVAAIDIPGRAPARSRDGLVEVVGDEAVRPPSTLASASADEPLRPYLSEIARIPLLTAEAEIALGKAIERGRLAEEWIGTLRPLDSERPQGLSEDLRLGKLAQRTLIESNLRLVVSLARKYQGRGLPLQDLIQEGNLGLIRAVAKFDYRLGFRFTTYAVWWIRQGIVRGLAAHGRLIRLPVHTGELASKIRRASLRLVSELGREPTRAEIARAVGVSEERVREVTLGTPEVVSLDLSVVEGDNRRSLGEVIEDSSQASPIDATTRALLHEHLASAMDDLSQREQQVLRLRYGLGENRPLTLQEVGGEIGVTRERARQIVAGALLKLRNCQRAPALRSYLEVGGS
jgi:RNA polymerase primary sigma factor